MKKRILLKKYLCFLLLAVLTVTGIGGNRPALAADTETAEGTSAGETEAEGETADTAPSSLQAGPEITAKSAVLLEGSTGRVLYEKNKDEQLIPASITKIMTILLIFEALDAGKIRLEDEVTVSEHAASMGGSQVFFEPYETQTVETMIKCITIASANDGAVAMAEHIAGSEEGFVAMMNERAAELGMENTHFLNCCGLDDNIESGHYSSAYDVALMSRELIVNHPEIQTYSTVWMDSIIHKTKKGESEFGLTNTNKLVRTYDGITGLKTGSTSKAKYCLSATANRNNIDMIAVIMAAPDYKVRFTEAAKLLDYGFSNCRIYEDKITGTTESTVLLHALEDTITGRPAEDFRYVCVGSEDPEQITKETVISETVTAPVEKGASIGTVTYKMNGTIIGQIPVLAEEEAAALTFGTSLQKIWKYFLPSAA